MLTNQAAQRLIMEGVTSLQQGRPAEARERFQAIAQTGRANSQIWLLLATSCRALGDVEGEEAALDSLLALDPWTVRGRIMKGDCRLRCGDEGSALGFYKSALSIASEQQLPADLMAELRRAETAAAELFARRHERRESFFTANGLPPENRSERFKLSLEILSGAKTIYVQEPTSYYYPNLPQIQFFDREDFPWVAAIEAAAGDIRRELESLLASGIEDFRPYIRTDANRPRLDDSPLLDSQDWSALFLCENGVLFDDAIAKCPITWEAVQAAPLPRIPSSPTVMFSLLRAGARIAPHTGTHNTRLVCHLPLIIPSDCRFRVGNEVRQWEEGKLLIFDDSIEHEAWNDSAQDRVVLIFDIWRPELSERERREVGALFGASSLE
jgi:tetratricopeptide (TPR) repeat protein